MYSCGFTPAGAPRQDLRPVFAVPVYLGSLKSLYRTIIFGDSLYSALKAKKKRQSENRLKYGKYYYKHYILDSEIMITQECLDIDEIDFVCRQKNGKLYTAKKGVDKR